METEKLKKSNVVYQSKSLNNIRRVEKALWVIPIGIFLYYLIGTVIEDPEGWRELVEAKPNFLTSLLWICFIAFWAFFLSVIPFLMIEMILHYIKKPLLRNNRIITFENFDYYRDKFTGLSPAAISMLADLNIEKKKDISASILKYQDMGILKHENNRYVITEKYRNVQLRESDRYLIEGLASGSFNAQFDTKWVKLAEREAVEDGLITNRSDPFQRRENRKRFAFGCIGGCLTPIILYILAGAVLLNLDFNYMDAAIEKLSDNAELISFLNQNPQYCLMLLAGMVGLCLFIASIISPVTIIIGKIIGAFSSKPYKRTELGNQMAEYVYGMKNFIHDYSNLSEADQEHVVLWDDYLVYAIVLEENSRIINEIMKRRNRK